MSFSFEAKNELCRLPVQKLCCARAEAYGVGRLGSEQEAKKLSPGRLHPPALMPMWCGNKERSINV